MNLASYKWYNIAPTMLYFYHYFSWIFPAILFIYACNIQSPMFKISYVYYHIIPRVRTQYARKQAMITILIIMMLMITVKINIIIYIKNIYTYIYPIFKPQTNSNNEIINPNDIDSSWKIGGNYITLLTLLTNQSQ